MKQGLSRIGRLFKNANKKKIAISAVAAIAVVTTGTWGALFASTKIAEAKMARDCDNNAIMYCGAVNVGEFVSKYNKNSTGDLDNIYAHYGLSSSELARFQKTAKLGYVTKSGDVVLDGKVVGTNSQSVGRQTMAGSSKVVINGKTYYQRPTSVSFASNSIPALIMMNGDQVEFVALTACGNAILPHPKGEAPKYSCDMLNEEAVSGKTDTFNFSSKVTAEHGAKLSKVVYDFGDGTPTVTKTNPSEKVSHTYKPGKFTAKVTAYFTVNGETQIKTATACTKPVEVKQPPVPVYACVSLTAKLAPNTKNKYTFTATAKAENGATLKSGDFDFGDTAKQAGVAAQGLTVAADHEYTKDGTYTATATLTFNVGNTTKTATCQVVVTPSTPQPPIYSCTGLAVAQKSRTDFEFKASGSATNATITGYRYIVRDSADKVLETKDLSLTDTLQYSQTTVGTYSVSAQVLVTVNGQAKVTDESDTCRKPFEVKPEEVPPVAECTALTAVLKSGTRDTYDYSASTKIEGKDASVVNYLFDFGDGNQQTTTGNTASHTYAKDGTWKSRVTVTFMVAGQQVQKTSDACAAQTTVQPPEECKPGIPVGDSRCTECKPGVPTGSAECQECKPGVPMGSPACTPTCQNGGIPSTSAECAPTCDNGGKSMQECQPAALPATGAEAALPGLFGTSALAGAGYYWRQSRKAIKNRLPRK